MKEVDKSHILLKQVGFLWNRTVVDKLSSTSVYFIRSEGDLKNCAYMEPNRLTEHTQSQLGGVSRGEPFPLRVLPFSHLLAGSEHAQ